MAKKIKSEKYEFHKESVTLAQAVSLHSDILESDISNLWRWYFIGYAIMVNRFTRNEFLTKAKKANKTTLSMAVSCATYAQQNDAFRKKLETDGFGSLRAAWDAIPNKQKTSREKASKRQSVVVDVLVDELVELGLTPAQARKAIKKASK